jgi:hypothetical protein
MFFTPRHAPISSLLLSIFYIAHNAHKDRHAGIGLRRCLCLSFMTLHHWLESRMEYARWRHAVLGLRLLGRVYISVVVVRLLAGGRPAATPFSCFAKKRKQKKATQSELTP